MLTTADNPPTRQLVEHALLGISPRSRCLKRDIGTGLNYHPISGYKTIIDTGFQDHSEFI